MKNEMTTTTKKLMAAFAVALASTMFATSANAAMVNWQYNSLTPTYCEDNFDFDPQILTTLYLIHYDFYGDVVDAVEAGKFDASMDGVISSATLDYVTGTSGGNGSISTSAPAWMTTYEGASIPAVAFLLLSDNGEWYAYSTMDSGRLAWGVTNWQMTVTNTPFYTLRSLSWAAWGQVSTIPEPSTALLALAGVGLLLRRRRR